MHRHWQTLNLMDAAAQFFGKASEEVTEAEMAQIRAQYEYDWNHWPAAWGAPYEDVDGDGAYNSAFDVPGYPGADQTLWVVTNDLGSAVSERLAGSPAIGIEYQLTLWGVTIPEEPALDNVVFKQARLIYTGTPETRAGASIDSMFVSVWADPDLGDAGDDFVGVDTTLSFAYVYNGATRDEAYDTLGLAPPAVGWDLLQGPVNAEGNTLGITTFVAKRSADGLSDPELGEYAGTLEWYNFMRGFKGLPLYPAGERFVNPLTGETTTFLLTGNPLSGQGWIDDSGPLGFPGGRRLFFSSGPFEMALGDTVDVFIAQVGAISATPEAGNSASLSQLLQNDRWA